MARTNFKAIARANEKNTRCLFADYEGYEYLCEKIREGHVEHEAGIR